MSADKLSTSTKEDSCRFQEGIGRHAKPIEHDHFNTDAFMFFCF